MFGLFDRKKNFSEEMAAFDKAAQVLGAQLMLSMSTANLSRQAEMLRAMIELNNQRIHCCKRNGKFEEMAKWQEANDKAKQLLG